MSRSPRFPLARAIAPLLLLPFLFAGCADPPSDTASTGDSAEAGFENPADRAGDPLSEPQTLSLLGEPLYAMEDTTGAIDRVDAALAEAPDDVDRLIAAGRERRHSWHYRQAIELYTRAAELDPGDWRPYRFRGHRYLSLREFDRGIEDLEAARERAPLNWDVAYHLGLAYFLAGRFDDAADEYLRCFGLADDPAARAADDDEFRSCAANEDDPESWVAMAEWTVRALMRADREAEARRIVDGMDPDLTIGTNVAYHHNLLMHAGVMTPEELLSPGPDAPYRFETVGFGVANWMLATGNVEGARELLERLMDDPWWPGFGRLAAEAELARMGGV